MAENVAVYRRIDAGCKELEFARIGNDRRNSGSSQADRSFCLEIFQSRVQLLPATNPQANAGETK